jgi:3-methyl-2-oxobutanoate hydroxymethyltransferase
MRYGGMAAAGPELSAAMQDRLVEEARALEAAGAALLDFTNSGPLAGEAVCRAVRIPVIGGLGGGPWLDGRVRAAFAALGYLASAIDDTRTERYAALARAALDGLTTFADDVRAARQIRGAGARTVTT